MKRRAEFVSTGTNLSAYHLRCAQRSVAQRVEQWLIAQQITTYQNDDLYAASAEIVSEATPPCDLFFAGVDWLRDDELGIVQHIANQWPQCRIVVYAGLQRVLPCWQHGITSCVGIEALGAFLLSEGESLRTQREAPEQQITPTTEIEITHEAESLSSTMDPTELTHPTPGPAPLSPPSLTPEELAALLAKD